MSRRTVLIAFAVSIVVNVAGVVFFVRYLNLLGHFKLATQEVAMLATNLNFAQTANVVSELAAPDKVDRRAFISHFDGEEDFFAAGPIALPNKTREVTLFVFLHGMGHNCMEPFVMPKDAPLSESLLARDHSYVVLSSNYRAPAGWVSDAALSDITQTIHLLCDQYPVKNIVLIGSSMGGCVALSYCAIAPADIKQKLVGVVCVEGSGDLAKLYERTGFAAVRATLEQCLGGPPQRVTMAYAGKSMLQNITSVPGRIRLAIVSARQDKTVPPDLQDDVYNTFKEHGRPVVLIPVEMDHGWPPAEIVNQAVDFVLKKDESDQSR